MKERYGPGNMIHSRKILAITGALEKITFFDETILHIEEDCVITLDRETGKVQMQEPRNEAEFYAKYRPVYEMKP